MPFVVTSCFLSPQGTQSERIRSQYISPVRFAYWLFRLFSRHISRMQSFQENRPFTFQARVIPEAAGIANRSPRSLLCQNKRRHTDRQTNYRYIYTVYTVSVTLAAHARRGSKPSANCACAVPLLAFTRSLALVARGESDTG